MTRHLFVFLGTFVGGALIALAARTAKHEPHATHAAHAAPPAGDYAPLVTNAPAAAAPAKAERAKTEAPRADSSAPVNTRCAICGMDVDPKLPTLDYKGKKIGFGCRMCPPKFKADPDKYGPHYLRNEVIER